MNSSINTCLLQEIKLWKLHYTFINTGALSLLIPNFKMLNLIYFKYILTQPLLATEHWNEDWLSIPCNWSGTCSHQFAIAGAHPASGSQWNREDNLLFVSIVESLSGILDQIKRYGMGCVAPSHSSVHN